MKGRLITTGASALLAVALLGAAPTAPPGSAPLGALASAEAAVTKSLSASEGAGNVSGAGNRLGTLLTNWAVPVLIVLGGCLLIGALASRNVGASFGIILITLIGLIFLLAPTSIESLAKQIANTVL